MSVVERINKAVSDLPNDIALAVLIDVEKRITDWKASGGNDEDDYIEQQAKYAENMAIAYSKKETKK